MFGNLSSYREPGNGAFWYGVGIATAVEVSMAIGICTWIWSKIDIHAEFTNHVSHRPSRADKLVPLKKAGLKSSLPLVRARPDVLDPKEWRSFRLLRRILVSPNVYRFIFALPRPDDQLDLPTGQHIALRATIRGQVVSRSYTPVSNNSDLGRVELLVKVYDQGLMSKHLESMEVGSAIEIRGPKGAMQYGRGYAKHIGMIAGGTSITPMYQLIRAICEDESDDTKISLLYANNYEEDILMRDELDAFAQQCPEKFSVHYILSKPPQDWEGSVGFITLELIEQFLPPRSSYSKVLLCGPPPMINAMKKNLAQPGFKEPGLSAKTTDEVFLF